MLLVIGLIMAYFPGFRPEVLVKITGFNVGVNDGVSAGQTVMHCHIHLIPRRDGGLGDPRGGVRGVIPDKQKY